MRQLLPNKKIVSIIEYKLTGQELSALEPEYAALLATLCYAADEINVLSTIWLLTRSQPEDDHVKQKWKIQHNTLLRLLSAKVFEALIGVSGYRKTLARNSASSELLAAFEDDFARLAEIKQKQGFETAKLVRDKATYHYLPSEAVKNLTTMNVNANRILYLHNTLGDSFYPIGSEVVFEALFERRGAEIGLAGTEVFHQWLEWTDEAHRAVVDTFVNISMRLVAEAYPEKSSVNQKVYVEPAYLGDFQSQSLPLFFTENTVKGTY